MKLSHSKLSCILSCPMTYFLQYKMGINRKETKAALSLGSAVHWGLEHNTSDLTPYFKEFGTFKQQHEYTNEQCLCEAMVAGYLERKEEIFDEILTHPETGERLELVKEIHEIFITGNLKSYKYPEPHKFVGIIDLLLLVMDKNGQLYFIIIDYKTSSSKPDWDTYLDQIYRYIFLARSEYPEVPVLKTGIINLLKTRCNRRANESIDAFKLRMFRDYKIKDDSLIQYHMYETSTLDETKISAYLDNLSRQADTAECIDENNVWFINFGAAENYGGSPYKEIFYQVPNCYVLYNIQDNVYDEDKNSFITVRDCRPVDMLVISKPNVLNKYEKFETQALAYYSMHDDIDKDKFFAFLRETFETDDILLNMYWKTLVHKMETQETK